MLVNACANRTRIHDVSSQQVEGEGKRRNGQTSRQTESNNREKKKQLLPVNNQAMGSPLTCRFVGIGSHNTQRSPHEIIAVGEI